MNTTQITLTSDRLQLVPTSEQYAEEIFREFTKDITTYMFPNSPDKIAETVSYIRSMQEKMQNGEEFPVVILDKKTGEFLGGGGAHKLTSSTPELGIWIKKSAHGNRYGREAVHKLKRWIDDTIDYEYIIYPVDKRNIPSRKIAESLGGIVEAEYQKQNISGNILDVVEYRIYKS